MATDIFISNPRQQPSGKDFPVLVCGGTPSMSTLVYPVANIIEEKYPEIYAKAFESLAWGEVRLSNLNSKEFMIVYEITKKVFLERDTSSYTVNDARAENWNEYMEKLEQDPRCTG